jgi:hypothetical protein
MNAPAPLPPDGREHTKWSPALLGFYASCAGVSLGAAIAFGGHFFFRSTVGLVCGSVLSIVSCVTCFLALSAARRPPEPKSPSGTQ